MKNIFKFSLFALFVGFTACDDATDIIQADELPEEMAFRTVEDLQTGLNGVYAAYSPDAGGNGAGDMLLFNDLFTDNIKKGRDSSGQGNEEFNLALQASSTFPNTLWANRYATINFANRTLRAWERLAPTFEGNEVITANRIKAQLLTLRALCHFDLLQYFTTDYQDPNSLSVIIMDFVPDITQVFPRNTTGEVFDFINGDLAEASQLIGGFVREGDERAFFINSDVINAIEARVALTQGDYVRAEQEALAVINGDHATYGLSIEAFEAMFLEDEVNGEAIFTLSRRQNENAIASLWYANEPGENGSPFFEVSNQLYNLYFDGRDEEGEGPVDIRKIVTIHPESEFVETNSPDNFLLVGKYRGSEEGALINDVKLIRTAEMYLIKAECEARAGLLDDAENTVELLLDARITDGGAPQPQYDTTEEALEAILLERRKEFAFEGHRYLDLKRLGRELDLGFTREDVDCASFNAGVCNLLASDYRWTLPIPRNEINANPTIVQNPNY